jgi:hypothetical protein
VFEVSSKIEIIQNNNSQKENSEILLDECSELLKKWTPRMEDESDLELHAELWTKLANLALNGDSLKITKLALFCTENALKFGDIGGTQNKSNLSRTRLRWYSIADFLYSRGLCRVLQVEGLTRTTKEELFLRALKHALEAAKKGYFAKESKMVRDAAKLFEEILRAIWLSESQADLCNMMIKPIYSLIYYFKMSKENSQEILKLEDSQLITRIILNLVDSSIECNITSLL